MEEESRPPSSGQLQSFFLHHSQQQQQQQSPSQDLNPNPRPEPNPDDVPDQELEVSHPNQDPHQELDRPLHRLGFDDELHAPPPPQHHLCEESNGGSTSNFFFSHVSHIPSATAPKNPNQSPSPSPNQSPSSNPNPNLDACIDAQPRDLNQEYIPPLPERSSLSALGVMANMAMASPAPDPFRRKRGRPRKYALNVVREGYAVPLSTARRGLKKARMMNVLSGCMDQGFRPHIIAIAAGEDLLTRMMSFAEDQEEEEEEENGGMCILSANGVISNVALTSGGAMVTYEGRYEIVSISGSFARDRGVVVKVSLAGPDGRIIGGEVDRVFVAAAPVKLVVATLLPMHHQDRNCLPSTVAAVLANHGPFHEPFVMQKEHGQIRSPAIGSHDDAWPYRFQTTHANAFSFLGLESASK